MISRPDLTFERGPIRPPSEARSLLIRVIRNCPWNRCTFCPVYKNTRFEARSLTEILKDIENIRRIMEAITAISNARGLAGSVPNTLAMELINQPDLTDAFRSVAVWMNSETRNVFLQDADPLVLKTPDLIQVLTRIRSDLAPVGRITAYARSMTTHRLGVEKLVQLKKAGLDRVHTGLESGCAEVLKAAEKGGKPEIQVSGGKAVRDAGLELSLYIMPGLGGAKFTESHARQTADVISEIEPDFIRLRTLAVAPGTPLHESWRTGDFEMMTEIEVLEEIKLFLQHLRVSRGRLESDHILNLLSDLQGDLPDAIPEMIRKIDAIVALPQAERILFQLGKRAGVFRTPLDLDDPFRRRKAELFLARVSYL